MSAMIRMSGVHRAFGDNQVLTGLDFELREGSITGLLGVNGAGKTTLIQCVLGMLRVDDGQCQLLGEESWNCSPAVRERVGFVSQEFDNFEWMRVGQMLTYVGAFYPGWNETLVEALTDRFELDPKAKIVDLSVGMKQRLSIVMALGHEPELLVLDEPVASLDPAARRDFVELMLDLHRSEGKTILFSTHITSDVERLAADVALMRDGAIGLHTDLDDLKQSYARLHLHGERAIELADRVPGCIHRRDAGAMSRLTVNALPERELAALQAERGVDVEVEPLNLEEIFLEVNR